MIEIYPNLFIGDERDYKRNARSQDGWSVVHACKEPYHRNLLGYSGRGAPKNHPEYFFAKRGNRLFLNLIDSPDPNFIPKRIIDKALDFTKKALESGNKVLVHCNQGESRSPSIGLLYLAKYTNSIRNGSFAEAEEDFRKIYPGYFPKGGMRGFLNRNWSAYMED